MADTAQRSAQITDRLTGLVLHEPLRRGWLGGFALAFVFLMLLNVSIAWLLIRGIGIWGVNQPVAWGFAIVNFVWWIGIGHAGTFISAILLLLHQQWRTAINRFTEAMTLFAVACAGLFPLLHLGRPWVFYWLAAVSRHDGSLAAVALAAGLGCLRGRHVSHRLADVLVHRSHARSRGDARSRGAQMGARDSTASARWAGAIPRATGNATRPLTCCSLDLLRRSFSRCTAW